MRGLKISDVMTQNVLTIHPGATVAEAARRMENAQIGVLPVCESDRLVGIVTDRDLVSRAVASGTDPSHEIVANVMSMPVVTVGENESVQHAVELITSRKIGKLVVLSPQKRVVGIVTAADLALQKPKVYDEGPEELPEEAREVAPEKKAA